MFQPMVLLRWCAASSASMVVIMLCLMIGMGVDVTQFERVAGVAPQAHALLQHAAGLRWVTVADDAFVACYVATTLLLVRELERLARGDERLPPLGLWVAVLGMAVGVLDLIENHHVLALLRSAEQGLAVDPGQWMLRELTSALKWTLGHVAFVLVGLMLPVPHRGWWVLKFSMVFVQLPVGVMTLVWQGTALGDALNWWRLVNVLAGFVLLTIMLPWPPAGDSGARA